MVYMGAISTGKAPRRRRVLGIDGMYGAAICVQQSKSAVKRAKILRCILFRSITLYYVIIVSHCSRLFIFHRHSVVVLGILYCYTR